MGWAGYSGSGWAGVLSCTTTLATHCSQPSQAGGEDMLGWLQWAVARGGVCSKGAPTGRPDLHPLPGDCGLATVGWRLWAGYSGLRREWGSLPAPPCPVLRRGSA